ncbi:ComF family protein [Tritonibacter horizontis]|uniref:Ribose-phosphate pyrophosphokinase n=1 Tax=Tritonibacter horizontis TaxID=1768241 RepID=A0A132C2S2_9RHOB|nr:ComF family protein [Tritonibacter horizontis]KUP94864.1 ribose-phosphate pyrophosphokinase [Tritonibacter horizontis]
MTLRARIQTAVTLVYPARCLNCGGLVESDFGLCSACWRETEFISGLVCDRCGVPVAGEDDGQPVECDDCAMSQRDWSQGRAALVYGGQGRRLVLALKHGDRTDLAHPASAWMLRAAAALLEPAPLVVPVPLHWSRLLRRRYNQSALLAQALAARAGCDWVPDSLIRSVQTPMLEGRSRQERTDLLADAIRPHPRMGERMTGRDILLVDDVLTSGATLSACARACYAAGAKRVSVVVLARVTAL